MASVIDTTTTSQALAGSGRYTDRQGDRIWVMFNNGANVAEFWVSDNEGLSWAQGTRTISDFKFGSMCIVENAMHVLYVVSDQGASYYQKFDLDVSTTTMSHAYNQAFVGAAAGSTLSCDIVAYVDPNTAGYHHVHKIICFNVVAFVQTQLFYATHRISSAGGVRIANGVTPGDWGSTIETGGVYGVDKMPQLASRTATSPPTSHATDSVYVSYIHATSPTVKNIVMQKLVRTTTTPYSVANPHWVNSGGTITITASPLANITGQSMTFDGVRVLFAYTDASNVFLRSRDEANTATTDYAVPTLGDGGFTGVSVAADTAEDDIYLCVTGTSSADITGVTYDRSVSDFTEWTTVDTTNAVPGSLHVRRYMYRGADQDLDTVWVVNNGGTYNVSFRVTESGSFEDNPPTAGLNSRVAYDALDVGTFSWSFSDLDAGDTQTAYELTIQKVSDGTTVYATGKVFGSNLSINLPGGTLLNNLQYQWKVRVWDRYDVESAYTSLAQFWCSRKPTVAITTPEADGASVTSSRLSPVWVYADTEAEAQTAYRMVLKNSFGAELWNSGKTAGAVITAEIDYDLPNSENFSVDVTVWDGKDVPSATQTRTFVTTYTPPPVPLITLDSSNFGFIRLVVDNDSPPDPVTNHVYRQGPDDDTFVRISDLLAEDGTYDDYAVASGVTYTYYVRAQAASNSFSDSATDFDSITFTGVLLHDPVDADGTFHLFQYDGVARAEQYELEHAELTFAGRTAPVLEFGEHIDQWVSVSLQLTAAADVTSLRDLIGRKSVLCYRDSRGRKVFGIMRSLPLDDERWGHTTDLEIQRLAYDEAV